MKIRHPRIRERVHAFFQLDPDRPLYTHGPLFRIAMLVVILSSLISAAGFAFSLVTYSSSLDRTRELAQIAKTKVAAIQISREESVVDTCRTIRAVIQQAYMPQHATVRFPATLSQTHSDVTLIRNGRATRYQAITGKRQTIITVVTPQHGSKTAKQQIRADGLVNCVARGRKQTALPK